MAGATAKIVWKRPKPILIPFAGPIESIWHQGGTYLLVIAGGRAYRVETDGTVTEQPEQR